MKNGGMKEMRKKKETKKSTGRMEGRWAYLSEQHHVLHDKGNVEQRGKTVEEVELRGKQSRQRL